MEVTVNNLTVIITDYTDCKVKKERRTSSQSDTQLNTTTSSIHSDSGDSNMSSVKTELTDADMVEEKSWMFWVVRDQPVVMRC